MMAMPLPSAPISGANTSRTELPAVVDSRPFTPREDLFEQKTEKEYHRQDDAAANFTTAPAGKQRTSLSYPKSIQQEAVDEEMEARHIQAALAEEEHSVLTGSSKFLSPPSAKGLAASRSSFGEESVDEFGFTKRKQSEASIPPSPASKSQLVASETPSRSTAATTTASKTAGKPTSANQLGDESFPRMAGQKRLEQARPSNSISMEGSSGNFDWMNSDSDLESPVPKAPATDWKAARAAKWKQAAASTAVATPAAASSSGEVHNTTPAPVRRAVERSSLNRNMYNDFGEVSQSRFQDASEDPSRETSVSRKDPPAEEHELDASIRSATDFSHPTNFGASLRPGSSNTVQHRIQTDANDTLQFSPQASPSKESSVTTSFLDRRKRMNFVSGVSRAPGEAAAQSAASPSRPRRSTAAVSDTSPIQDHYADQVRDHGDPAVKDHGEESQEFDFGASQDGGTWLP